ncbi:MAG: hypothetical protein DRG78_23590 [Epsilonproteobacteria bacterium]|nr:MAG: hypothetical protein DRG78_23590 [Campylobacterota bacterium]
MTKDIDTNNTVENNPEWLNKVAKNDYYKNDRDFINIIKKLTQQSADINNKALSLVSILDEAEKIKFDMVQKEIALGLSNEDKPYGNKVIEDVKSNQMIFTPNTTKREHIQIFINLIESYFNIIEVDDKRKTLIAIKDKIAILKNLGENPKHFITNQNRAKVWYILEYRFKKTLKKLNIDLFIDKIKLTRMQYQNEIDGIYNYYQKQESTSKKIAKIRQSKILQKEESNKLISEQYKILEERIDTNIAPLVLETRKIVDSLDFNIEDISDELSSEQHKELTQFIPAISEYYIDQTYALSKGNSYTSISVKLEFLQDAINQNNSIGFILSKIDELDFSMQHLYLLHWIAESLLKDILKCYEYKCSLGKTVGKYFHKYQHKETNFRIIMPAILIRNDIAHNALIWEPEKLELAIGIYRKYISNIALEQNIDLSKYKIPRQDREFTLKQKEQKNSEYIKKELLKNSEYIEKLDSKLYKDINYKLEKTNWKLSNSDISRYRSIIENKEKRSARNEFSQKYFHDSYDSINGKLREYDRDNNTKMSGRLNYIFEENKLDWEYKSIQKVLEKF